MEIMGNGYKLFVVSLNERITRKGCEDIKMYHKEIRLCYVLDMDQREGFMNMLLNLYIA